MIYDEFKIYIVLIAALSIFVTRIEKLETRVNNEILIYFDILTPITDFDHSAEKFDRLFL